MSAGGQAFLRFRELERQLRESLEVDKDAVHAWGWVASNLERVYSGDLLPGTRGLANLGRGLEEKWVSDRSYDRTDQLAHEFAEGLGLPPGSWAAGPAPGWSEAVAEAAAGWGTRRRRWNLPRQQEGVPRLGGWSEAARLSMDSASVRAALDAEPDGELLVVLLDACLVPLHTRVRPPQELSLEPLERALDAAPRGEATLREVAALRSALAGGFAYPPRPAGTAPGWDEAVAAQAPHELAHAARRRELVERREGPLDLAPVPTLHDAPGWAAATGMRELEQRVREALAAAQDDVEEDERELDAWLRPLYAGDALPGQDVPPLALRSERAAAPAAVLADAVRTGLGTPPESWSAAAPRGWADALTAVAPAWLQGADLRAAAAQGLGGQLRRWFARG